MPKAARRNTIEVGQPVLRTGSKMEARDQFEQALIGAIRNRDRQKVVILASLRRWLCGHPLTVPQTERPLFRPRAGPPAVGRSVVSRGRPVDLVWLCELFGSISPLVV
jgi:hypothetical protein